MCEPARRRAQSLRQSVGFDREWTPPGRLSVVLYKIRKARGRRTAVVEESTLVQTHPQPPRAATFSPLYLQIKSLITKGLQSGEWKPGEAIPSEGELARRFGVSQGTVRKAVDEMAADNLLVRRQGRGTFVATHHEDRAQFRFLRLAAWNGPLYAFFESEFATPMTRAEEKIRAVAATAAEARLLAVERGAPLLSVERVSMTYDDRVAELRRGLYTTTTHHYRNELG